MFSFLRRINNSPSGLVNSSLFDESTFYKAFINDLKNCKEEVVIESPFITGKRAQILIPIFKNLFKRGVNIYIITRDPDELDLAMRAQSYEIINILEEIGIEVLLCTGHHHRKLAILDRKILWEGSLNILSQTSSREIMRRINGREMAEQMINFLELTKFI